MPKVRSVAVGRGLMAASALALVLGVGGVACKGSQSTKAERAALDAAIRDLSVDEVETLIAKNEVTVIDNNTQARWRKSHLPTAKWVDFSEVKASDLPADKDCKLVFYCANEH